MNDSKWIMWVLGVLIMIASTLSGYAIARIDTVQQNLTEKYIQKTDYRIDMERIDSGIKSLNDKMDRILRKGE